MNDRTHRSALRRAVAALPHGLPTGTVREAHNPMLWIGNLLAAFGLRGSSTSVPRADRSGFSKMSVPLVAV